MGKKSKSQSKTDPASSKSAGSLPFVGGNAALDPTLSSLFANSAGPVKAPVPPTKAAAESTQAAQIENDNDDANASEDFSSPSFDEVMEDAPETRDSEAAVEEKTQDTQTRKRKRGGVEDDLEESYMRRIAKEEQKAEEKKKLEQAKRQKQVKKASSDASSDDSEVPEEAASQDSDDEDGSSAPAPVHESLSGTAGNSDVEKSNRTVFLGNVSTQAIKSKSAKKTLLRHLASFCSTLPESTGPHKVESIRFRSILDETTPSTNAYAVYTTIQAARKAPIALNGTVILDRHLRVDSIAHPAGIDNKRCVFVGNLSFVDHEAADEESGKKKKNRAPADIEEGLWRTFNAHTGGKKDKKAPKSSVEFVRVIRDRSTRVGKGFAYVQFYDGNGVEEALLLNEKNFPPLLPRKLRVTRARKMAKKGPEADAKNPRMGEAQKTLQGRAGKLLGRAGAAKIKADGKGSIAANSFVFEGHRATEGNSSIKAKTKSRGSKGKPKNRSSKRAAAYRAAGGQKP
ncbi:Nucleolar protein 12 [Penicillium alfredii]|uniref:Nucleolar protein 12 n=1 Tax=Penicillium alfredii TaxID=1506179 RepID=A0A9W9F1Z9_9EURO|nr:Nucleolar protein 12 [Penicillium alfredii]KAJ5092178.1 Nucleolar protein 12 [Penicillium alfredii]